MSEGRRAFTKSPKNNHAPNPTHSPPSQVDAVLKGRRPALPSLAFLFLPYALSVMSHLVPSVCVSYGSPSKHLPRPPVHCWEGRNEGKMGRGFFTPCRADETYQLTMAPQAAPTFTQLFGQQGLSTAAPTEEEGTRGRPAEQAALLPPCQRKDTCLQHHWP